MSNDDTVALAPDPDAQLAAEVTVVQMRMWCVERAMEMQGGGVLDPGTTLAIAGRIEGHLLR